MYQFFEHLIHEFELPLSNPVLVFSLVLLIILLSPIVLRKLNIPGIIGLILSGVIIGQHGLHILEKNSAVDLFSTIGLLYIMFIAGLELDLNEFKANRNKSLLFGAFTFIFPIAIGYPVCYYLLGYDFNASFLTASMFATHTLVAYPIVSKMGISKNQAVAITVGGTILTDTAVLIILAVIMGNSQGTLSQEWWITFGVSLTIFSIIMFLIVPRIAKWFFRHLESEKHSHYIFVLSVVFFSAFLAEVAGVEPIIGAFVAGLALNRLVPYSSALMNRIEFIGNSLFIPFFLISVGMIVDVSVLLKGPMAWIVAGALSFTALFGKWIAALFTQLIFRYSPAQRQLIFGLSSSHAAATLAVILVGYQAGILDENILNGTIILILITCIVASLATERAAKKIVVNDENGDTVSVNTYGYADEHLLLPITHMSNVEKLLEFALLIKERKSPNPISILSVVPNDEEAELNIIKSRHVLEEYVKQASAADTKINIIATIDHNTISGIARMSREIMADIILIGWPQRSGILEKLIGDRIESILNAADKVLFICHFTKPMITNKRIVVITPPLAERENGFELWFLKISKLAQELSIPVQLYGDVKTHQAIGRQIKKHHLSASVNFTAFEDWEDFLILARDIRSDDLLVFASSRQGSVSHQGMLENVPMKLERHFSQNSKIVIYPQQYGQRLSDEGYEDIPSGPITKSIETIGRGIDSIFRREKKE
ncbi:MAG TPA: cation:proton antiporter [Saprospiraceae bacterium]|nr:cation:proton antiporter [Saprospiraceae bacterium]